MDTATSLRLCGVTGVRREDLLVAHLTGLARAAPRVDAGRCGDGRAAPAVPQPLRDHRLGACRCTSPPAPSPGAERWPSTTRGGWWSRAGPVASPSPPVTSCTCGPGSEGGPVMPASPDPGLPPERPQVPHPPRPPRPPRPPGGRDGAPDVLPPGTEPVDDVVRALLGEPRTCAGARSAPPPRSPCSSARRFWHALGFPNVDDEDTVFTEADLQALRSVVGLVRDGRLDETTALSMTRALGRTTDRLAFWQIQLMAEALGDLPEVDARTGLLDADGASSDTSRAVPDPATARAAALRLTELADRLEPLAGLRVAPAPERRRRAHGRRRRARADDHTRHASAASGSPTWSRSPAGTPAVRARARRAGPAVRGAGLRHRDGARRPGDQDGRRRGALRDRRDRAGGRHRARHGAGR